MEKNSQNTGKYGEDIACNLLKEKGYDILERNWRFRKYEVDIIAQHKNSIVFVEVKSRSAIEFGEPETFVDRKKQRFLISAANEYIIQNNISLEARFDIISVLVINNSLTVKHLEDAFYPSLS